MKKIIMLAVMAICAVQTQAAMTDYLQYNMSECYYRGQNTTYLAAYNQNESALSYYSYYGLSTENLYKLTGLSKLKDVDTAGLAYGKELPSGLLDTVRFWARDNCATLYTQLSTGSGLPEGVTYHQWKNTQTTSGSAIQLYDETVLKTALKPLEEGAVVNESAVEQARWVISFYKDEDDQYKGAVRVTLLGYDKREHSETYSKNLADTGMVAGSGAERPSSYPMAWMAATIPEPTSGLLMLLGVAGLALKRKRLR